MCGCISLITLTCDVSHQLLLKYTGVTALGQTSNRSSRKLDFVSLLIVFHSITSLRVSLYRTRSRPLQSSYIQFREKNI